MHLHAPLKNHYDHSPHRKKTLHNHFFKMIISITRHISIPSLLTLILLVGCMAFLAACRRNPPPKPDSMLALPTPTPKAFAEKQEFIITTTPFSPEAMVIGTDGNLWFAEEDQAYTSKIGRMTPTGNVQTFDISTKHALITHMTAGINQTIWFTEYLINGQNSKIGSITQKGVITEFELLPGHIPQGITAGHDGRIWFTEPNTIGYITSAGAITEFPLSEQSGNPQSITTAPDGNLWFSEIGNIGRITPQGFITEFALPDRELPSFITMATDGTIWFAEVLGNNQPSRIGHMTQTGTVNQFTIENSYINGITNGDNGTLWFTQTQIDINMNMTGVGAISHITPDGTISELTLDSRLPGEIVRRGDGKLWFIEADITGQNWKKLSLNTNTTHSIHKIAYLTEQSIAKH